MPEKIKPEPKSQSQSDKFKAMAKEVEADGDEKAFDASLKTISGKKGPGNAPKKR